MLSAPAPSNTHATADAQRGQALLGIAALHFVLQGHQNTATRRADRVANGDGATIHVDLGRVNGQFLVHGASLGGEGFVQLEQVHIRSVPARALQGLARCRHRAHAHGGWVEAGSAKRSDARQGLEAQGCGFFALITTTAAAPSLMPEALPAVTVPALSKAGRRPASTSALVLRFRYSSSLNRIGSPFFCARLTARFRPGTCRRPARQRPSAGWPGPGRPACRA